MGTDSQDLSHGRLDRLSIIPALREKRLAMKENGKLSQSVIIKYNVGEVLQEIMRRLLSESYDRVLGISKNTVWEE